MQRVAAMEAAVAAAVAATPAVVAATPAVAEGEFVLYAAGSCLCWLPGFSVLWTGLGVATVHVRQWPLQQWHSLVGSVYLREDFVACEQP